MDAREWVHPDSHANIGEFLHRVRAGERYHVLGKQVRKDGTVFPADGRRNSARRTSKSKSISTTATATSISLRWNSVGPAAEFPVHQAFTKQT